MLEYLPWSVQEFNNTLDYYKNRKLSILDIELGGACNLSCVYCDTPDRVSQSNIEIKSLEQILLSKRIQWIFICGLGEPTVKSNKRKLLEVLSLCKKYGIRCSMFTNLVEFDDELFNYIKSGILYILFKLDTFESPRMQELYGIKNGKVLLSKLKEAIESVNINNSLTNIAASIVPTSKNKDEVIKIIEFCLNKGLFPLIGDLENCGMPQEIYQSLKLKEQDLFSIKLEIQKRFNIKYKVPICPSVIGGIHINSDSEIVVDEDTGLSCHWFWLQKPKVHKLLSFTNKSKYEEIVISIINYRNQKLSFVTDYIPKIQEMSFGGCGGDIKYLLNEYINAHNLVS